MLLALNLLIVLWKVINNCIVTYILETLRKYPPVGNVHRQSVEPYTFPDTKLTIPKDFNIEIPILAIHRDPDIYEDPLKWNPERFNSESYKKIDPVNFIPFGIGLRKCIGL